MSVPADAGSHMQGGANLRQDLAGSRADGARTSHRAYGAAATAMLAAVLPGLPDMVANYVHAMFARIDAGDAALRIAALPESELQERLERHRRHVLAVLDPGVGRAEVLAAGERMGLDDALAGLDSALLADACMACMDEFIAQAASTLQPPSQRAELERALLWRLLDDMNARIAGLTKVVRAYQQEAMAALPRAATPWSECIDAQLFRLVQLPGIVACAMIRPDADGVFRIESFAGHEAMRVFLDGDGDSPPRLETHARRSLGLSVPAWRNGSIEIAGSYASDPRCSARRAAWERARSRVEVSSVAAIPVLDRARHTVTLLLVYGRATNQFASAAMRVFVEGLQRRLGTVWEQSNSLRPLQLVREEQARSWRERLFAGGLEMFMQPIVHLRDGRVGKVEALARLRCEDGSVVSPGAFLPLLGETELHWLFREGLEQSLSWIRRWDSAGLAVDVSLNLPPSALVDARCLTWVDGALRRHGLPARRLTLEILETQHLDSELQQRATEAMSRLGVLMAMDDLGAGYSSLKRLASSRFDLIKIDQALFRHIYTAPLNTLNLVGSLIHLGRDYDCEVVVEGLEDPGMIEVAGLLGASFGQGWGLGRPMEPGRLPGWMGEHSTTSRSEEIATPMGALASAWNHVRHGTAHGEAALRECPLTAFLLRQGRDARQVRQLHERLHLMGHSRESGAEFLDWFVARMPRGPESVQT